MGITRRNGDRLGVSAVTIQTNHLAGLAELLGTTAARVTLGACHQIVQADPVADLVSFHAFADGLDRSRYLMTGHQWKRGHRAGSRLVVHVGAADAGRSNRDNHLARTGVRFGQLDLSEGRACGHDLEGFHGA